MLPVFVLRSKLKPEYRIVIIYLVVGALWISFSDALVNVLFDDRERVAFFQSIKGWFFVVATSFLLFLLIRNDVRRITRLNRKIVESYDQTVLGWISVMDVRHKETKDHTERVTKMAVTLASLCGIRGKSRLKRLERGAILHDIGKIGIADSVLTKPGALTEPEWEQIKQHPIIAYNILSGIKFLKRSLHIPYCHHEKWDGTGYPQGLRGKEIPKEARIFAVVDVWDALIHPRVYKDAWPEERVLQYLRDGSAKQFDPKVVDVFLAHYEEIKRLGGDSSGLSVRFLDPA
ncbi:MAG: HD-GYP domain-containing protein [Gammaproteobacteria bacterium]|nr:HD-GYP domain-containing protein [Pseudomonadales bacterium]